MTRSIGSSSPCASCSWYVLWIVNPLWHSLGLNVAEQLLYCIGIPLAITVLLLYKRRKLSAEKLFLRYSFLVARFKERFFLFEVVIQMRKVYFCSTVCTLTHSPSVKLGVVLSIVVMRKPEV